MCLRDGTWRLAGAWHAPRELPAKGRRRRDRIRPTMQLIHMGPWGVLHPLESQMNHR